MAHLNNPAGRLLRILQSGRQVKKTERMRTVWANILEVPPEDTTLLLQRLAKVIELPAAAQEQIRAHPNIGVDIYLKWVPRVEKALSVLNLDGPWQPLIDHIDPATIHGLEVCDDLLSRHRPDVLIKDKDLHSIHSDVRKLFDDVVTCDLADDIREYLLGHLKQMDRAIQEFKIGGAGPVRAAVESTVGAAVLNPDLAKRAHATSEGRRFWKVIRRIALMIALANSTLTLPENIAKLLPKYEGIETIEDDTTIDKLRSDPD